MASLTLLQIIENEEFKNGFLRFTEILSKIKMGIKTGSVFEIADYFQKSDRESIAQ